VSVIFDQERKIGVVLNERSGEYWEITGISYIVTSEIFHAPEEELSLVQLSQVIPDTNIKELEQTIFELNSVGIIQNIVTEVTMPRWKLVFKYAFYNLLYQILLKFLGWKLVYSIRHSQLNYMSDGFMKRRPSVIDEMMAASRLAGLCPGVRRSCVPSSLAIYRTLKSMGYSPRLEVGGEVTPFEPHMWVELFGHKIDVGVADCDLQRFQFVA